MHTDSTPSHHPNATEITKMQANLIFLTNSYFLTSLAKDVTHSCEEGQKSSPSTIADPVMLNQGLSESWQYKRVDLIHPCIQVIQMM